MAERRSGQPPRKPGPRRHQSGSGRPPRGPRTGTRDGPRDGPRTGARGGPRGGTPGASRSGTGGGASRPAAGSPASRSASETAPAAPQPPAGARRAGPDSARPHRPRAGHTGGRTASRAAPRPVSPASGERIAKLLARAGVGSRRDVEQMIAAGRIAIDGAVLTTPATILTSLAGVTIDGQPAPETDAARLFLFHKPVGVLTASRDPAGRPTIYDILPPGLPRLMPVGRLDLNTEGLLLLTNDGELKRALELPLNEIPRSYRVRALGAIRQAQLEALATGVSIAGVHYGPVDASIERRARPDGANVWLALTLREGRNREVRRLCESLGLKVNRLIRTSYGPFLLADLPVRAVVEVPAAEVVQLKRRFARPGRRDPARS